MRQNKRCRQALCAGFLLVALGAKADSQPVSASSLEQVRFEQRLGTQIKLSLPFCNEEGERITLGDYFGQKPVILVLGYYRCPMLCSVVLNGLIQGLLEIQPSAGREFNVVCVSISPAEGAALAAAKKSNYLKRYGRPGAAGGWHFLTGDEPAIRALAGEVGYHYVYDASVQQYAHPSGFVVLTPEGKVSRYFLGVTFSGPEVQAALEQAAAQRVGSRVKELLLLCFGHVPLMGKNSAAVMLAVRIFAAALLVAVIGGIGLMLKRNASGGNTLLEGPSLSRNDAAPAGSATLSLAPVGASLTGSKMEADSPSPSPDPRAPAEPLC